MRSRLLALCVLTLATSFVPATEARADWFLTPYVGMTFGGSSSSQQANFGLSSLVIGGGPLGVEVDASITPNFFKSGDLDDSNVSTVMANLVVATPRGSSRVRGYLAGGAGLLRTKATSVGNVFDVDEKSFGVNVGGGVMAALNDRIGFRGDLRYFRSLQDSDAGDDIDLDLTGFNFWRGTLGVSFRF